MSVLELIGLVSGLLAIFTFVTGVTSARELFRQRSPKRRRAHPSGRFGPAAVVWLSAPVFAISMAITLAAGLSGSDTGGAQFILLVGAAILLLVYATVLNRRMPWTRFMMLCTVVLAMAGLLMGLVTRGEELEGLLAGTLIGACAGLLALALPTERAGNPPPTPGRNV